jgi:transcriptional regulator with XRE-family HTH domain
MDSLPSRLEEIRQDRGLTNLQFAERLGMDSTVMSRLCSGKKGVSHGIISRLLVKLDSNDAQAILQAYFEDELERIREGREAKARELGVKPVKTDWPHRVRIESDPS